MSVLHNSLIFTKKIKKNTKVILNNRKITDFFLKKAKNIKNDIYS